MTDIPLFPALPTTRFELQVESDIRILGMNTEGPSSGQGTAQKRKKIISSIIQSHSPDLVFLQEFQWTKIDGHTWKDAPIPSRYLYTGNKEASIIYDADKFQLSELKATDIQRPLEELKRTGKVGQDFAPVSRICIRLLQTKEPKTSQTQTVRFLCISWHGMHRKDLSLKKKHFQYLQIFLKELSQRQSAPVLICGDFNLNMTLAMDLVSPDFILYSYTPTKRRRGKVIDFYMTSQSLRLSNISVIDITKEKIVEEPTSVLDHDPLLASVALQERKQIMPQRVEELSLNVTLKHEPALSTSLSRAS